MVLYRSNVVLQQDDSCLVRKIMLPRRGEVGFLTMYWDNLDEKYTSKSTRSTGNGT